MNDKHACRAKIYRGLNVWFFYVVSSHATFTTNTSLPGPRMKPKAWQALMFAIAPVLSFSDVAPATYDLTTATLPNTTGRHHML